MGSMNKNQSLPVSVTGDQTLAGTFVRIAIDRLRPCTTAELLVSHCTQTDGSTPLATEAQAQRGLIGEHTHTCGTTANC